MLSTAIRANARVADHWTRTLHQVFKARTSSARVCAGTTVTLHPSPRSLRRMFLLDSVVVRDHVKAGRFVLYSHYFHGS